MLDRKSFEAHDWEQTPLGPSETWHKQLRFLCDFLLGSEQPMFLLWGDERAFVFNAAYQRIWDIDSLENLGQRIERVAGTAWDDFAPLVDRVFSGESFLKTDFPIVAEPGREPRYFDFSYTPVYDYDDTERVAAALCISTDVTERFLSAQTVNLEREILALTVENVTEGVALIESDFTLVLWNEPFRQHFGYAPDRLRLGMNAAELIYETARRGDLGPGDPGSIVASFVQSIRSAPVRDLEIERANDKALCLHRRELSGGRQLLVSRDVTDERKAARLKDELVSTVSHELRTPLTAIAGALGMVAAGAAGEMPEKADRLIKIAQRNTERLIALVNDLLDVDKLRSGKVEYQLEKLDLVELIHASIEQNQTFGASTGVTVLDELPTSPVLVISDRNRLLQVLANLLSNAIKFSPPQSEVRVRLTCKEDTARVDVIDHGAGVAEEFRGRLFERFSQQDASPTRSHPGTGLGLVITKNIVEQLGGTVGFEPSEPQGATFHFELPLATQDELELYA